MECSDRDVVVEAEDRRRSVTEREQLVGSDDPVRDPPVGVDDELGVEQDARRSERGAEPVQPLLGRIPARSAGDRADAPVSEREQVLGRLLGTGGVHRSDARDPVRRLLARIDDDEGIARAPQQLQLFE